MRHYILNEKKEAVLSDLMTWAKSFERIDRKVAHTKLKKVFISTVFLGLDHNFFEEGPPLIFETMVFKNEIKETEIGEELFEFHDDLEQERYSTWDEAIAGHKKWVKVYKRKENLRLMKK